MRSLGDRAPEVVPHGAKDPLILGLAVAREGTEEVTPRDARGAQVGADTAAEKAANGRRPADRQAGEDRHDRDQAGGLTAMGDVAPGGAPDGSQRAGTGRQRRVPLVS